MVSITTAILACVFGFMAYVAIPIVAIAAPISLREKIGTFYLKLGTRCLKQFTFVRRVLSGYDVLQINVDNEQKLLKGTLSGSITGESDEYRYADPAGRIKRLFAKPVALAYENVPAAIDAELAELGYWVEQKKKKSGLFHFEDPADADSAVADPYVPVSSGAHLVDPLDAFALVPNDVSPEDVKTAEKITEMRYAEYGGDFELAQTMVRLLYFGVGFGAMICAQYVNDQLLDGGGPPNIIGSETVGMVAPALDAVVMMV